MVIGGINPKFTQAQRRFRTGRRFSLAWIETGVRWAIRHHLVPDLSDLAMMAGLGILGWVLYQLTPLLAETFAGFIFCAIGLFSAGIFRKRDA